MSSKRRVVQLFETTSAVNGALDTGVLDVEEFDSLGIVLEAAGAAVTTLVIMKEVPESGAAAAGVFLDTVAALAAGNSLSYGWPASVPAALAPQSIWKGGPGSPLSRRVQFQITAVGAGATGKLTIWGMKREPDAV